MIKGDSVPVSAAEKFDVLGGSDLSRASALRLFDEYEKLFSLLHEVVKEANAAEDAGDFVLWVQEELKAYE